MYTAITIPVAYNMYTAIAIPMAHAVIAIPLASTLHVQNVWAWGTLLFNYNNLEQGKSSLKAICTSYIQQWDS